MDPLSQVIREDMEIWAESHMWPFSCYSCQREGSCLPGLRDVSPEELRWQAYQAKMGSGGEAEYLEILRKLNDVVLGVRGELMRVRASNVGALVSCIERVVCTGFDELGPESAGVPIREVSSFWYIQFSMKLGPEDVSLLERCPHFRG